MPKVIFDTAEGKKTVNFDQMPSQQDIEEVAAQFKPAVKEKPMKESNGVPSIPGAVLGAVKSQAQAPANAASLGMFLGEKLGETGVGKMIGEKVIRPAARALGVTPEVAAQVQEGLRGGVQQAQERLKPVGAAEEAGAFAGDIASTFLTGGMAAPKLAATGTRVAAKAVPFLSRIGLGSKTAGALGTLARGAGEAAVAAGQTAAQTERPGDIATAAGIAGAIPVVGGALKGLVKGAAPFIAEAAGKGTGAGVESLLAAYDDPKVMELARKTGKLGQEGVASLKQRILKDAQKGLENIDVAKSKEYRQAMSSIKASAQDLSTAANGIKERAFALANDFGIQFDDGKLVFDSSDIVEGAASVRQAFNRLISAKPSVEEMDRLKKSLGRLADGAGQRTPAQAFILQLKNMVSTALKEDVPG